jgi:hypothetical protein
MTALPKSKKDFMSAIEKEWGSLIKLAESLTDEQMTRPDSGGWSPKDNLAHISEWMKSLMGHHMDQRPAHVVMKIPKEAAQSWDMEIINPILFERNRDRTRKEVMTDLKRTYKRLYAKLDAMTFKDMMKPRHPEDPKKRPLLLWIIGDTTDHFKEHRNTITRGLKEKS